jgi:hypothetical protein
VPPFQTYGLVCRLFCLQPNWNEAVSQQSLPQDKISGLFDVPGQAKYNNLELKGTRGFFWIAPFEISRKPKFNQNWLKSRTFHMENPSVICYLWPFNGSKVEG